MDIDTKELIKKYKSRLEADLSGDEGSGEYRKFKIALKPHAPSRYERVAAGIGKYVQPKMSEKKLADLQEALDFAQMQIPPSDVVATAYVIPIGFIMVGMLFSVLIANSMFMAVFAFGMGCALIAVLSYYPYFVAGNKRNAASNQMVLCIFYVVTYMRHTSNLERGVGFAAEHLGPPLSNDMNRVLWNVQSNKYDTVQKSLAKYMEKWEKYNRGFVESFNLIQSSLAEGNDQRRIQVLEKALDTILETTYESMLHFAQNLKSPVTLLYMMGIILPILGMVMLPMAVSFMETIRWWHIAIIYNIGFPGFVFLFGKKILAARPGGYGSITLDDLDERTKKAQQLHFKFGKKDVFVNPLPVCLVMGIVIGLLAFIPVVAKGFISCTDVDKSIVCSDWTISKSLGLQFLGYRASATNPDLIIGPFGLGATLLASAIPLALALSIGLFYYLRSSKMVDLRESIKKLENEFSGALFQFGNRLGDGIPAEIAFERVTATEKGTAAGNFFSMVTMNIRKLGMGVQQALFDPKRGAVISFPSPLISSSMRILSESVKKGPLVASQAMLNIARYVKEIHKVDERLRDLMAEILGDMKSQIAFLTPVIASIVIAITTMIATIMGSLTDRLKNVADAAGGASGTAGGTLGILSLFGDGIPPYFFQIIIGVYVFELVYLLTIISNNLENGDDLLEEQYRLGNNLVKSTLKFVVISTVLILVFSLIASSIVSRVNI